MPKARTRFASVEVRAWREHSTLVPVSGGIIEITVARGTPGRRAFLQFRLDHKIIRQVEAERLINGYSPADAALRKQLRGLRDRR